MIGKKEVKQMLVERGMTSHWLARYSDKNKTNRKVKFRNYSLTADQALYDEIANELNRIDGGGWIVKCLCNQPQFTNCNWELVKYYNN